MKHATRPALFAAVTAAALLATVFAATPPASADSETDFMLSVYHGINGRALGLDKDLPVDVYVNTMPGEGDPAIEDLTFKTRLEGIMLPAGEYTLYVTLADATDPIMSFGPAMIPAGADVSVQALLGKDKMPRLKVSVR